MHSECMVILTPAVPVADAPVGGPRGLAEVLRREIQWACPAVTASVAIGGRAWTWTTSGAAMPRRAGR
jgi:hypothetical protein